MGSPWKNAANVRLTFQKGSGVFVTDEIGNTVEVPEYHRVWCSLKEDRNQSLIDRDPINREPVAYLSGYTVNPKFLPSWVGMDEEANATVFDLQTGHAFTGKITFLSTIQKQFRQVTKALGSYVQVYFQADTNSFEFAEVFLELGNTHNFLELGDGVSFLELG